MDLELTIKLLKKEAENYFVESPIQGNHYNYADMDPIRVFPYQRTEEYPSKEIQISHHGFIKSSKEVENENIESTLSLAQEYIKSGKLSKEDILNRLPYGFVRYILAKYESKKTVKEYTPLKKIS